MSESGDPRAAFPVKLRHCTVQPYLVYRRSNELFATRDGGPDDGSVRAEFSVTTDAGDRLTVYRGAVKPGVGKVLAVYQDPASTRIVVPSGRIFIRFAATVSIESRRAALAGAGYRIVVVPAYAPHCAWVEAESGDAAEALAGVERLEALDNVENVEPQWLAPRAPK